jgi:hypothetical protein
MDHRDDSCAQKNRNSATFTTGASRSPARRLLTSVGLPLLLLLSYNGMAHPRAALARAESVVNSPSRLIRQDQHVLQSPFTVGASPANVLSNTGVTGKLTTSWITHQGTYRIAAISMDMPGKSPAMSIATITERMVGNGDPGQKEISVQEDLAAIGVHLRIQAEAVDLGSADGIDTAVCSEATVAYEYTRAVAYDRAVGTADAVILFTPHKTGCLSGGVTVGKVIELETPLNGWIDPRMIEHELGHGLLRLSHSGVANSVDRNTLDSSTNTGSQYGPDSVMGASPVGWSGVDQLVAGSIHPNRVTTVTKSGDYTIQRRELNGDTTKPALLRIPLKGHTGFYSGNPPEEVVLEYEVRTGADGDPRFGTTQVIVQTWTETKPADQRLVEMTWEVGRLTPTKPKCIIDLPTDQVTITEVARNGTSVRLRIDVR